MLRAYARALAAVGAAARDVERADYVEHVLLKVGGVGLGRHARIGVIEHALLTRTCGTDIAARVAADAAGSVRRARTRSVPHESCFPALRPLLQSGWIARSPSLDTTSSSHYFVQDVPQKLLVPYRSVHLSSRPFSSWLMPLQPAAYYIEVFAVNAVLLAQAG